MNLDLGHGLHMRVLASGDAALLAEATSGFSRHCRDWSAEDAEHDTWHDCLIWAHVTDQPLGP